MIRCGFWSNDEEEICVMNILEELNVEDAQLTSVGREEKLMQLLV